jgi:hypothetical protein
MTDLSDNEIKKLCVEALLQIEWQQNGGGTWTCHGCGNWEFQRIHRNSSCPVDRALNALGYTTRENRDTTLGEIRAHIAKEKYG